MYFPDKTPDQAVRNLRRWIENCPDLVAALKEIGMPRKHKKDLTARQVRIIMEYLGDPQSSGLRLRRNSCKLNARFSLQLIALFSMQLIALFSMQLITLFSLQLNTRIS